MPKEIFINVEPQEKRAAVINDDKLEEFYIERPQDKTIVGNIYKGVIEAVLPSIGAAFVDIGLPKKGFLYLSEIESAYEAVEHLPKPKQREIKKGQEVLVQVVKESFGNKGPRLSTHIGLAGRYLVLMPQDDQIGVSRRIDDEEERKRLKLIFKEFHLPGNVGIIVRTAAFGKSKQQLFHDANFLLKLWKRMEKLIESRKAPCLIYEEYDLTLRVIRDSFSEDVSRLYVDSKEEYYRIRRFMTTFLSYMARKVEFYRGDDLFHDKDIERQISRIFETKVYLKSKAYIIIEPTEGLVVIDVNSGGFKKKLEQEEAAFKVNCEAAEEVAHQLKLRDLGGIIVIDFIDMGRESHRREVLNVLKRSLRNDRAKYDILGISKFGVVEMTRERIHNTVQTLSYQPCPYCQGKGKIKSPVTVGIYAVKELKKHLKNSKSREVALSLNPAVVDEILKDRNTIKNLERRFRAKINLLANPAFHIEDVKIN
ncbi:MAG: Rne/Rng family ribonuclease [Candidatus Omnitrophica bacterium]|nr:Rne/Rng family ribonuclease [Candidatus Omnitrophota bacterium]MDD5512246.1 Rne/Rng family ribonuclease [Candidatus Omnitrophota bacterium]